MAEAGAPWQLVLEKVEQRCGYLLTSGLWSDCTFVVGSETTQAVVPAHKLVLAMASPVFEAMFYGELKERDDSVVSIPDVQPEAFRALIQYIYTGNITIASFDMAWDIWYGAKKYMLPYLVNECNKYICSVLGPKNACRAYEFARLFDENPLMEKCIKIISTHTKEILTDNSFEHLELDTVITIFSLDDLNVHTELDLFHALARYAKAEHRQGQISSLDGGAPSKNLEDSTSTSEVKVLLPSVECSFQTSPAAALDSPTEVVTSSEPTAAKESLKEEVPTIHTALKKIRFLTLTAQQFGEGPATSSLLTKAESFAVLMNIVCNVSAEPMPTGFSESRERRTSRSLALALCTYSAEQSDELSYEKDDIIDIISERSAYSGWWKGELRGNSGLFRSGNVKKL